MVQWRKKCGCSGGDADCRGGGGWLSQCDKYPDCVAGRGDAKIAAANERFRVKRLARVKRESAPKRELQLICTKHPTYKAIRPSRSGCGVCKEIYDLVHTFSTMQLRNALLGALIREKHDGAVIDRRFN